MGLVTCHRRAALFRHRVRCLSALCCTQRWKGSFFSKDLCTLLLPWGPASMTLSWGTVWESQVHRGTAKVAACVSCSLVPLQTPLFLRCCCFFFLFFFFSFVFECLQNIVIRSWGYLLKLLLIPVVIVMKCILHIHFTKVVYKDTHDLLSLCR